MTIGPVLIGRGGPGVRLGVVAVAVRADGLEVVADATELTAEGTAEVAALVRGAVEVRGCEVELVQPSMVSMAAAATTSRCPGAAADPPRCPVDGQRGSHRLVI
jgi:hypothetical protein